MTTTFTTGRYPCASGQKRRARRTLASVGTLESPQIAESPVRAGGISGLTEAKMGAHDAQRAAGGSGATGTIIRHGAALEPTSFSIESGAQEGVHVVSLRGELDLATAPDLRKVLEDELAGLAPVLINLSKCEFIDSTGIAVIVRAWQQRQGHDGASEEGGLLALCAPEKQVSRLLEVTGVDASISVFEDCKDGVEKLRTRVKHDG